MKREKHLPAKFSFPSAKIQSIGVDWLTCTQYRTGGLKALKAEIERVIYKEKSAGNDETAWKGQGYAGKRAGGASFGIREDTYLAILTSDTAREHWRSVGVWATNCSRIDIQVTFELEEADTTLFDRLEAHFCWLPSRRGRPIGVCRVRDNRGGNTLYVGSRASDWYMRVYDKGVEGKTHKPGILIRVEVERKRGLAKSLLNQLVFEDDPDAVIYDLLLADLEKLSVAVGSYNIRSLEVARVESFSDSQRRLAYLTANIRPIVKRLIEAGFGEEAMEILFHNRVSGDKFTVAESQPYWRT